MFVRFCELMIRLVGFLLLWEMEIFGVFPTVSRNAL
jgi:hypothetical protein